jgi:hypothetical protein
MNKPIGILTMLFVGMFCLVAGIMLYCEETGTKGLDKGTIQNDTQKLIKDLLSNDKEKSDDAALSLKESGVTVEPALVKELSSTTDKDKRARIEDILGYLGYISDKELKQLQDDIFAVIKKTEKQEDITIPLVDLLNNFHEKHYPFATRTYQSENSKILLVIGRNGQNGQVGEDAEAISMHHLMVIAIGGNGGLRASKEGPRGCSAHAYSEKGIAIAIGGKGGDGTILKRENGGMTLMGGAGGGSSCAESPIGSFSFGGEGGEGASLSGMKGGHGGKGGNPGIKGWEKVKKIAEQSAAPEGGQKEKKK